MLTYHCQKEHFLKLVSQNHGGSVVSAAPTKRLSWLTGVQGQEGISLDALSAPRSAQSAKGFFLPPVESVGTYGSEGDSATAVEQETTLLLGVRACELKAWNYLDKVMLAGQFNDPAYQSLCDKTLIVSSDCVDCTESCFCTLVGGKPFAEEGYDVNLTPIDGGFLAEPATEKGKAWLGAQRVLPKEPTSNFPSARLRQDMVQRLQDQNASFGFSASDQVQPELPNDGDNCWQKFAADCVECGACTNICPTCHCFYLYDQVLGAEQFERVRNWDSCLLSTYHRMAGGAHMKLSPRPALFNRLANRVLHKFAYSPEQYGLVGCVGCGRCIDACLGDIDIRQVVEDLKG